MALFLELLLELKEGLEEVWIDELLVTRWWVTLCAVGPLKGGILQETSIAGNQYITQSPSEVLTQEIEFGFQC